MGYEHVQLKLKGSFYDHVKWTECCQDSSQEDRPLTVRAEQIEQTSLKNFVVSSIVQRNRTVCSVGSSYCTGPLCACISLNCCLLWTTHKEDGAETVLSQRNIFNTNTTIINPECIYTVGMLQYKSNNNCKIIFLTFS